MHPFKKSLHKGKPTINCAAIFVTLVYHGSDFHLVRLAISGANFLDMALDIASVNVSCSGDMSASLFTAGRKRLLPLVDLIETSVFSGIVTSLRLVLLAQSVARGKPLSAVGNSAVASTKVAFAVGKALVALVNLLVHVGSADLEYSWVLSIL